MGGRRAEGGGAEGRSIVSNGDVRTQALTNLQLSSAEKYLMGFGQNTLAYTRIYTYSHTRSAKLNTRFFAETCAQASTTCSDISTHNLFN